MFQDSNKEYTGSGAGVAGGKPATPVSLSADQEASIQSASLAALQRLQQQQTISNIEATQAQLNDLARQVVTTQQGTLDANALADQWRQKQRSAPQAITTASPKKSVTPVANPVLEAKSSSAPQAHANTQPVGQVVTKPTEQAVPSNDTAVDRSDQEPAEPEKMAIETPTVAGEELSEKNNANNAVPTSGTVATADNSPTSNSTVHEALADQAPGEQEAQSVPRSAADQSENVGVQEGSKFAPGGDLPVQKLPNRPHRSGLRGGFRDLKDALQNKLVDGGLSYAAQGIKDQQKDDATNKRYGGALDMAGDAVKRAQKKREDGEQLKMGDAKDIAKQAVFDSAKQKVGQHAKAKLAKYIAEHPGELGDMEKLIDGVAGKKVDLSGRQFNKLADTAVQHVAKKGLENVAKTGAQQAVKSGASVLANEAIPLVGSISGTDAVRGVGRGVKQLKDGNVAKAATEVVTGVAKSVLVTAFRLSYEWYVVGLTVGLSLFATWILGTFLFFVPNRGMSFFEKLLVVALWFLVFFILLLVLGLILVQLCNGPTGWGIWAASWFSKTAADINKFCEPIGVLQAATQNIAR